MPNSTRLRITVRAWAILSVAGLLCAGAPIAHSDAAAPDPAAITLAPAAVVQERIVPQVTREPFDIATINTGSMAAKWRNLQPAITLETHVLALCRTDAAVCPPAAARFLAVIDAARALDGRARIGVINRAVNLAVKPQSDRAHFGAIDVWSTPLMTFESGAGDCEDYAIAKFVALREAGMADEDLRLVIVHDRRINEDHAVVAARFNDKWLILDNRRMALLTDTQLAHMTPLLALHGGPESPSVIAGRQPLASTVLASR